MGSAVNILFASILFSFYLIFLLLSFSSFFFYSLFLSCCLREAKLSSLINPTPLLETYPTPLLEIESHWVHHDHNTYEHHNEWTRHYSTNGMHNVSRESMLHLCANIHTRYRKSLQKMIIIIIIMNGNLPSVSLTVRPTQSYMPAHKFYMI